MLSVRRKKDREVMAADIAALAAELGVACERAEPDSREILLRLSGPRGISVTLSLYGRDPHPNVHVVPWYLSHISDSRFADNFESSTLHVQVNPIHRRKATAVVYGFVGLLAELRRGFTLAKTGDAFLQPAETAQAAE